jgi:hypothetical protein
MDEASLLHAPVLVLQHPEQVETAPEHFCDDGGEYLASKPAAHFTSAHVARLVQQLVFAAVASPAILPFFLESLAKPASHMLKFWAAHVPVLALQHPEQVETAPEHFCDDGGEYLAS